MAERDAEKSVSVSTGRAFSGFSVMLTGSAVIIILVGAAIGSEEVRLTGAFVCLIAILYLIAGVVLLSTGGKRDEP